MMTRITFRLATADDVDSMVYHRHAMFAEMGLGDEETLSRMNTDFRVWALDHLANETFWTWFACDGDKIVCGAGIYRLDWAPGPTDGYLPRAYIYNVYTETDYRKQGIARRLMEHVLNDLRERGIRTVGLHASDFARSLYEKLNFIASNEMQIILS
ncbi:MAG: GNAT family N-acetyltransferase [Anaerolineae bacterium]|nr:GNAT family N-acetyltransferase [Anaerolineae bacterium]MDQ7037233.1 GNAT family N-acetyltransferase [Anaerolineae bacterium]